MSAALGLLRLQQVDLRMGRNQARLNQIHATLENNAEVNAAQEALKAAQTGVHECELARRLAEAEARALQVKIGEAETALYGGTVRMPKELQELQAEIESLKKHLAGTEERELQAMLSIDTAQAALHEAGSRLNDVQARFHSQNGQLIAERSLLAVDQENLQSEREAALGAVTADILDVYEDLCRRRTGVAVAEVTENACGACGTTLTAALQQNARHAAQLVHCPSCGRILFVG
jgi:predicted  nucleic acid-binding Zn-ribbon protein